MIIANPVTYDTRGTQTNLTAVAARAVAGRPKRAEARAHFRPTTDRLAAAAGSRVRE